jgi:hypothetical protein
MKKTLLTATIIIITGIVLSGCGTADTPMDQPADDGKYHYENKSLGFEITLPSTFEYYQTQRKEAGDYKDIEFFVPTSDTDIDSGVPNYAKPLVVRIFNESAWEEEKGTGFFKEVGRQDDKVYTAKFWNIIPKDWEDKWDDGVKQDIIDSFKLQ